MDFIKQFTVATEPGSQVKVTGEIPFSELEAERAQAIAHLGRDLKVDGFRPGRVPEKVIIERIGEMALLHEMAERTLARVYPQAIRELKIDAIGYPAITITKIAPHNPLGFTATVAIVPELTLPDYTKIAREINTEKPTSEVTEADLEAAIADIQRQKAAYERLQQNAAHSVDHADHHHHDHDHEHDHHHDTIDLPTPETSSADADEATMPLPALTDEYVQTLGAFETVADFKGKVREHLTIEKEREAVAAHRAKLTDAIIAATTIELPHVLVDSELDQMAAQMREELDRAHLRFEDYLTHIKKTEADLRTDWTPAAEKRARLQLLLNAIAKDAAVVVDETAEAEETTNLMERFPDADRERVRVYVHSVLQNEAVMQKLETI